MSVNEIGMDGKEGCINEIHRIVMKYKNNVNPMEMIGVLDFEKAYIISIIQNGDPPECHKS